MSTIGILPYFIDFLSVLPLIAYILFFWTLFKTLKKCSPENRHMKPGMVWLCLIPLFGLVWQFFVVVCTAKSLEDEFKKRNFAIESRPGQKLGLIFCTLSVLSLVVSIVMLFGMFLLLGMLMGGGFQSSMFDKTAVAVMFSSVGLSIATLVFWILYWIKIEKFYRMLSKPYSATPLLQS